MLSSPPLVAIRLTLTQACRVEPLLMSLCCSLWLRLRLRPKVMAMLRPATCAASLALLA
ncbi:hypothetical protein XaFJ1_GM002405 [Xanthomonas albilineans]|nr:hypothetical protein XaFJ1_GM002405 [Xanthomonas albilineans]